MQVKHVRDLEISWKNVFNGRQRVGFRTISEVFAAAKAAGYPFVDWNGIVYDTNGDATEADRIIESSKLPK